MANETYQAQIKRLQGGNQLDIGPTGIVSYDGVNTVQGVTWTVGTTASSTKNITLQLTDGAGNAVAGNRQIFIGLFGDANGAAYIAQSTLVTATTATVGSFANLGSTGTFRPRILSGICSTAGTLDLIFTDTGHGTAYIGAVLPSGLYDMCGSAITTTS